MSNAKKTNREKAKAARKPELERALLGAVGLDKVWWLLLKFGKLLIAIWQLVQQHKPLNLEIKIYRLGLSCCEIKKAKSFDELAVILGNLKAQAGIIKVEVWLNGELFYTITF